MTRREIIQKELENADKKYSISCRTIRDLNWALEMESPDNETAELLRAIVESTKAERNVLIKTIDFLYTELAKLNAEEN